jgi:hypothetical protein
MGGGAAGPRVPPGLRGSLIGGVAGTASSRSIETLRYSQISRASSRSATRARRLEARIREALQAYADKMRAPAHAAGSFELLTLSSLRHIALTQSQKR